MRFADVIVLGVGGMGSAVCYQLAARGVSVIGLEQFEIAHAKGSSHGDSRLIRKAYFEHSDYVPLCRRSYEHWDEIGEESGRKLLHRAGLIIFGPSLDSGALKGVLASAALHDLEIEEISPERVKSRFPQFRPPDGYWGVLEPEAGFLEVENCVETQVFLAKNRGAEIRANERVLSWTAQGDSATVKTEKGEYSASRLIIAAGPWSSRVLDDLGLPLVVKRVPQLWYSAPPALSLKEGAPCFAFDLPEGFIYGVPAREHIGLKLARYAPGELVHDPLTVCRDLLPEDTTPTKRVHDECLPGLGPQPSRHAICLYTLTPDENFIIDRHPVHSNVAFVAGLSGHGFKFAPVIGEALADLALQGQTSLPIQFLKLRW